MKAARRRTSAYVLREDARKRRPLLHHARQARELEALRAQVQQMQGQIDRLSSTMPQLDARSLGGLRRLGLFLYFVLLPFHWLKRLAVFLAAAVKRVWSFFVTRIRRLPALFAKLLHGIKWFVLTLFNPKLYWSALYWSVFVLLLMRDGGWKEMLTVLRHPRQMARAFGLIQ